MSTRAAVPRCPSDMTNTGAYRPLAVALQRKLMIHHKGDAAKVSKDMMLFCAAYNMDMPDHKSELLQYDDLSEMLARLNTY